jgi:hypothetical protein
VRSELVKQLGETYKVLPNFLTRKELNKIEKSFIEDIQNNSTITGVTLDEVERAYGIYLHKQLIILQCNKLREISNLVNKDCLPSYCYIRMYTNGSELYDHRDRAACEITVSIQISGDRPWDISIENQEGQMVDVLLSPGDAVILDGINHKHVRDKPYTGTQYLQAFIHYVFTDSAAAQYAFDYAHTAEVAHDKGYQKGLTERA